MKTGHYTQALLTYRTTAKLSLRAVPVKTPTLALGGARRKTSGASALMMILSSADA